MKKSLLVVDPSLLDSGPLAPLGSVGRKSQGSDESVASRLVAGPANSETVKRPVDPELAPEATVNLITHTPFRQRQAGRHKRWCGRLRSPRADPNTGCSDIASTAREAAKPMFANSPWR